MLMDKVDKQTRSRIMKSIRSKDNKSTEARLRGALISYGVSGWKIHDRSLPGTPDFVFVRKKLAVFVDGCFWHGCPKCYRKPRTSKKYWASKVKTNIDRDRLVDLKLRLLNWTVIRIWEHSLLQPRLVVDQIVRSKKCRVNRH